MWLVRLPTNHSYIFVAIAFAWSSFQFFAGYCYGIFIFERANLCRTKLVRIGAYGIHHAAFYFLCSVAGFTSWYVANRMSEKIEGCNWSTIGGGTGAMFVALVAVSIIGVSGALPRILYLGNRPI